MTTTTVRFTKTDAETYSSEDGRFTIRAEVKERHSMKHGTTRKVTGWTLRDTETGRVYGDLLLADAKMYADGIVND